MTGESSSRARLLASSGAQVLLVGVLAGILLPTVVLMTVFLLDEHIAVRGQLLRGALLVGAEIALVLGVLFGIGTITAPASRWTGGRAGRVLWAQVILVLGTVLLIGGQAVNEAGRLRLEDQLPFGVLFGVPYALVAAMLLRHRWTALGAVVVTAALIVSGVIATLPPQSLNGRLAETGTSRSAMLSTSVTGYETDTAANWTELRLRPVGGAGSYHHVELIGCEVTETGECYWVNPGYRLDKFTSTVDSPGLTYYRGTSKHGYVRVLSGNRQLQVYGSLEESQELLRTVALTAREATEQERSRFNTSKGNFLYWFDLAGWEPDWMNTHMLQFKPTDPRLGPNGRTITVRTVPGQPCPELGCEREEPGLLFRTAPDGGPIYWLTRDGHTIQATGGAGVDRSVLRTAILGVRPASDAEVSQRMGPAIPRHPLERLRDWSRRPL
ncbi:hypothetical protein D5S17_11650 [Pseudonocardiaceae bacterium YIM PH 21723]|nr:hypothetical protein D5S17_11650 [Pseudonocardiaceae bacterium YIM PH 21723]